MEDFTLTAKDPNFWQSPDNTTTDLLPDRKKNNKPESKPAHGGRFTLIAKDPIFWSLWRTSTWESL